LNVDNGLMKKLFLLLFLIPNLVTADYEFIFEKSGHGEYFLDEDSVERKNEFIYYRYMVNYSEPDPSNFLSEVTVQQGECSKSRVKDLSLIWFIKQNGKGKSFNNSPYLSKNWVYVKKDSIEELLLKIVCLPEKISR